MVDKAQRKFDAEGAGEAIIHRLKPFLFDETEIKKVKLLGEVLKNLD